MPSFLVFGGANFYGRALIQQLCKEREQAIAAGESKADWVIRGVDKILPQLASFPVDTLHLYQTFDYRMGNLRSQEFLERAFVRDSADGSQQHSWDYVFNFAAEHKFGQTDQVYEQDVHQISVSIARLAAQFEAGVLVQLSTAHVFKAKGNARHSEDDNLDPPHELAEAHIRAENDMRAITALPLVILRPALCYGPGDRQNVVPMLIAALLSKVGGEKMPVLWEKDLRVNTVHVDDVASAAIKTARWHYKTPGAALFNLADPGDTTNIVLAQTVAKVFGTEPTFNNSAVNFFVKRLKTAELTEEVNESLLGPWMDLLSAHGISNSSLSPYIDQEHPYCRLDSRPLGVDGSRITSTPGLGFEYAYSTPTTAALQVIVEEFQQLGLWPQIAA
ncbi:NAD-dependent epimerase/dehydratase [Kickxella alabastrina]|uniref:NAD-dependent epimerase/dehydratase n=1 Tax=Kickxella alabastrina TaxID=61397 RepID=UPI00221EE14E|nr:NAD-dependent epimerase/dehydratase [Kickxella alabastrina]KAI7821434.1 NAD-dependent epimerase/dehydratase [Kickxella alabastrina]